VDKVGIDAPFGWPIPFVQAITAHAEFAPWPGRDKDVVSYRRCLSLRATDEFVRQRTGRMPLSVSSDHIGRTAMRCALLLDGLCDVDRSGRAGAVAEVYPAASLTSWGLRSTGYKGVAGRSALGVLVDELVERSPRLKFAGNAQDLCVRSDDHFDAVIAAVTACAIERGLTSLPPGPEAQQRAEIEGWIHVPLPGSLTDMLN
jgi:hypothetical protein